MRTIDYPWYLPPFPEYNVAQSAAIPFLDKDLNLVISFATSTGKTVIAECCFGYHLSSNLECRVAYVCPYKSLASEKFKSWTEEPQLNKHGVVLWSSDSDQYGGSNDRMVVATLESFDSKTRSELWESWIKSFACVVIDEAHLIGDETRGGAMESVVMRLTEMNPGARIVLLSATMSNAMEVAKWVKSLNGKATKCIASAWRPVRIQLKYHSVDGYDEKVATAVGLTVKSSDKKTLVFVHSKVTGSEIVRRLRREGVRAVFHNASLSGARRRKIEDVFNDMTSGLNVIVSTSTLGHGVNMA